ncbi:MAG TPA: MobF family relaxase [Candidatus Paceibacterota bacterium]|nr:MobF family relaxase [Candidatus Paceibacterota bacterium]
MSLSISKPIRGTGPVRYLLGILKEAKEDYRIRWMETPGHWFGTAALILRLNGEVKPEEFKNLLLGFSPDGNRELVMNAGAEDRQAGWDLTFNAPKYVSLLWALSPPEVRREIEDCHQRAHEFAQFFIEAVAGFTRSGKAGSVQEPAYLLFANFLHTTSRALDPHLHSHTVLLNLSVRQRDGATVSIVSKPVFRLKITADAIYQAQLAANLRRQLGLTIVPEKASFRIVGVPPQLCAAFSKRRLQIDTELKRMGRNDAMAAQIATLATRPDKIAVPREQLYARWEAEAQSFGWGTAEALKLIQKGRQQQPEAKVFEARAREAVALLPPEQRSPGRIVRVATQLAIQHGVDGATLVNTIGDVARLETKPFLRVQWRRVFGNPQPWVPARQRFLSLETKQLFPFSPLRVIRKLRIPVIAMELPGIGIGRQKPFQARWGSILWKRYLALGELRVQERRLFPNAPQWSPARHLTASTIRFTARTSQPATVKDEPAHTISHSH